MGIATNTIKNLNQFKNIDKKPHYRTYYEHQTI